MLKRLKEMIQVLPPVYGYMINIIKFNCLTELRPVSCTSCKPNYDTDKYRVYYKPERNTLEHFRFP
jgi:hypothetical protein